MAVLAASSPKEMTNKIIASTLEAMAEAFNRAGDGSSVIDKEKTVVLMLALTTMTMKPKKFGQYLIDNKITECKLSDLVKLVSDFTKKEASNDNNAE